MGETHSLSSHIKEDMDINQEEEGGEGGGVREERVYGREEWQRLVAHLTPQGKIWTLNKSKKKKEEEEEVVDKNAVLVLLSSLVDFNLYPQADHIIQDSSHTSTRQTE